MALAEKPFQNRKDVEHEVKLCSSVATIFQLLSLLFAILGIAGDALNMTLGLKTLSWFLLAGSLVLVAWGFFLLKTRGQPEGDFEDTTKLITTGVYQYIRHPLYGSLIFFALGTFFKDPSWVGVFLVLTTIVSAILTARIEEEHNLERFGEEYQDYMEKTKRFIPFIY